MQVQAFFDEETFTLTYLVWDRETRDALVIDPVLDYDPLASQTSLASMRPLEDALEEKKLTLHAVLETHAHADHLSGSQFLKRKYGVPVMIGEHITEVQKTFKTLFDLPEAFAVDGSQFDRLLKDEEEVTFGTLTVRVLWTPGHTPACVSYLIEDAVFTGDALFMDDYGTGRCDFPKGSAEDLYRSVHQKLYGLPEATRVFVGHDYLPGRPLRYETTIGASRRNNPQLSADTQADAFVAFRTARDATLSQPKLLFQSVQVNIDAGRLPQAHPNGLRYLRVPINVFGPADEVGAPIARDSN